MAKKWANKSCCDFESFMLSLLKNADRAKFPALLINRQIARKYWRKGMTGLEAFITLKQDELKIGG